MGIKLNSGDRFFQYDVVKNDVGFRSTTNEVKVVVCLQTKLPPTTGIKSKASKYGANEK